MQTLPKTEWTTEVKQLQDMERQKRRIVISRISEGRSRGMCHESYKNFKRDKRVSQRASNCTDSFMTKVVKDIDEAAECDVRLCLGDLKMPNNI